MKLDYLSLRQILKRIRSQELKCVQVAEHFASNIAKNTELNAVIYFNQKKVLDDAYKLDKQIRNGTFLGRLHGAPLIVKDNSKQ